MGISTGLSIGRLGGFVSLFVALLAASCGPPGELPAGSRSARLEKPAAIKRVTAVVIGEHPTLISKFERALQGAEAIEAAVASGLVIKDERGFAHPILAEAVPTIENGRWRLFPDGRMETTWNLQKHARWHDGAPFTTDDVLFTLRVGRDETLPNFRQPGHALIEEIQRLDDHSLLIRYRAPFIAADTILSNDLNGTTILFPLPKHLLERPYETNREGFTQLPYWSDEFVGTGPFKLKEWARGSHALLIANDDFVLGRPKVDEIEVRFAGDDQIAIAHLLSGAADMHLGRGLSFEQAVDLANRWPAGRMENVAYRSRFALYPQFIDPSPPVIASLQFRRALMHATDRQTMADVLQVGLVPVAHTYLGPDHPMYKEIEPLIVKYEYDPRKAAQMIEELGYRRGPDAIFRDAAGSRLLVEARATPGDLYDKTLEVLRDQWQQAGVAAEIISIPHQRQTDQEWRATRPGFELTRRGTDLGQLESFHSRNTPLPETRYSGGNVPRYANPEFDALIDRYFVTVPIAERTRVVGQIMRHISDQLNMMHLFYDGEPALIGHRLVNVRARGTESTQTWNVHQWDVS